MKTRKKVEILAVLLLLLIIGMITSQIIFSVIAKAQQGAKESSIFGYAEVLRLKVYEDTFNASLSVTDIGSVTLQNREEYDVTCKQILYSKTFGIILEDCQVGKDNQKYYFALGKVYKDKNNVEFQKIWNYVMEEIK